jgi:hypothetical protein
MKRYLVVAAVLMIAACGKKEAAMPAVDSTATMQAAPAATDTMAKPDSMMARDTTHKM